MLSPETIYTQPTEMDSEVFIHVLSCTNLVTLLNKDEIGREEFGKGWRENKEGGK